MTLRPLFGHGDLLERLRSTIGTGRFPQATLLSGPRGVGKQRVALWIAQALLCEGSTPPCGSCAACRLADGLGHPDLHWFVPVGRLKASEPDKQVAEVEQTLAELMAERRGEGYWLPPEGAISHPLASVRLLQRRVALTPFRGKRKVVILGDADRLVVQEASQEAANALLKVLEEPPADTTLLLTTAEPQALLPTIRSRVVPVRVGPVPDAEVAAFLDTVLSPPLPAKERDRRVVLAEGAIGAALAAGTDGTDRDRDVDAFLAAVKGSAAAWAGRALGQAPWDARGGYTQLLDALSVRARKGMLERANRDDRTSAARLARIVRRVEQARGEAQGNRNPQLGLAVLARDMEKLS